MKFPYGICDFRKIIAQDYFLLRPDTGFLSWKEACISFSSAPREFGKSLLLSMLSNYTDVAKKEEFGVLFGRLKIVKNPDLCGWRSCKEMLLQKGTKPDTR